MRFAFITATERGACDACLSAAVAALGGRLRLAGGVQENHERAGRDTCDMDIKILPDGPYLRISQDLGPLAEGCRLDADALEGAVAIAARHLAGAEALIVNKWGKQEMTGRGFVPLIAEALERGLPVVVGVNAANLGEFRSFAGDLATELPARPEDVADWLLASVALAAE